MLNFRRLPAPRPVAEKKTARFGREGEEAAARHLRGDGIPGGAEVPILALTANAMRGDMEKSLASGMNGHLTKPVDLDDLARALSAWRRDENEDVERN